MSLQHAGVPLLTGTDSPEIPGMYPGYSLHTELRSLAAAGLSQFEALSAATRTPGEFMKMSHPELQPFGVVSTGSRADLIMLKSNPLEDVNALNDLLGVVPVAMTTGILVAVIVLPDPVSVE
jgi:imidazolonepropionase-like amidohydrolase